MRRTGGGHREGGEGGESETGVEVVFLSVIGCFLKPPCCCYSENRQFQAVWTGNREKVQSE